MTEDGHIDPDVMPLHVLHLKMQIAEMRTKLEFDRDPTRQERTATVMDATGADEDEAVEILERLERHAEAETMATDMLDRILPHPFGDALRPGRRR